MSRHRRTVFGQPVFWALFAAVMAVLILINL